MPKPVVAVDFDDVIAAFNQAFVAHHNQHYGVPCVRYENIDTFDMTKIYGVDFATIVARVRTFCHHHHDEMWPWADVAGGLSRLTSAYELHVVTSRCESLSTITHDWLVQHGLREFFTEMHFTNGFGSVHPERKRDKLQVCQQLGALALVEDAPTNAQAVADGGVLVFMPDRPWNRDFHHTGVRRITSLEEIPIPLG